MKKLSYTVRAGLFDELVKISEEEKKQPSRWKTLAKNVAVGTTGAALGYGAAHGLEKLFPSLKTPSQSRVSAARILLPLLGGASLVLADRYRRLLDESYSQVPGWKKPE